MKITGKIALDDGMTLSTARTVRELIIGVGTLLTRSDFDIAFEIEADDNEGAFEFGIRVQQFADELAAYQVQWDPLNPLGIDVPAPPKGRGRKAT